VGNLLSLFDLGEAEAAVTQAARVVVILLLAWLLQAVASRLLRAFHRYMAARRSAEDVKRIGTVERVLSRFATVLIAIVAGTLVLGELGISVLPILATAGVAGIAIGFGAQSLIRDYFTGFFLLLEDQIREGDVVEIAGRTGSVEEVSLRHVRLRDFDGNVYFVPNSEIKVVVNRTRGYAHAVADAVVKSAQKIEEAYAIMREVGRELRADPQYAAKILGELEIAGVERWEPWGLVLRCRLKVMPLEQWRVRQEFLRRLKTAFEERGIQSP
jgi:moderate conductance mechanosensitive channel